MRKTPFIAILVTIIITALATNPLQKNGKIDGHSPILFSHTGDNFQPSAWADNYVPENIGELMDPSEDPTRDVYVDGVRRFIILYDNGSWTENVRDNENMQEEILDYVENAARTAWNVIVTSLGFRQPLYDYVNISLDNGTNIQYNWRGDISMTTDALNIMAGGKIYHPTEQGAYTALISHEFFHAVQQSYMLENLAHDGDWILEGSAMFIESLVSPSAQFWQDNYLAGLSGGPYTQSENYRSDYIKKSCSYIKTPDNSSLYFGPNQAGPYAISLYWRYIYEHYGGAFTIKNVFARLGQDNTGENRDKQTASINAVLGTTDLHFADFATANYVEFSSQPSARKGTFYQYSDRYYENVPISLSISFTHPSANHSGGMPYTYATNYVEITPENVPLSIGFDGDDNSNFEVRVVFIKDNAYYTTADMPLDNANRGGYSVAQATQYDNIALVIARIGDKENKSGAGTYTVSLSALGTTIVDAPTEIIPTDNFKVKARVTNNLDNSVENVAVYLQVLDSGGNIVNGSTSFIVPSLNSKENTVVELQTSVPANTPSGSYTFRVRAEYEGFYDNTKSVEVVRGDWTSRATLEITSVGSALTVAENDVYVSGESPTASVPYSLRVRYAISRTEGGGTELHPDNSDNYPALIDGQPHAITRVGTEQYYALWETESVAINDRNNHAVKVPNHITTDWPDNGSRYYYLPIITRNSWIENDDVVYVNVVYCWNRPSPQIDNSWTSTYPFAYVSGSALWRWHSGTWENLKPLPALAGKGADLEYLKPSVLDGNKGIYAVRGGGTSDFWMYDSTTDNWLSMAPLPYPASTGADITVGRIWGEDDNNHLWSEDGIYAITGGNSRAVFAFRTEEDTWFQVGTTPLPTNDKSSLVWAKDSLYLISGGSFYRGIVTFVTDTTPYYYIHWQQLPNPPKTGANRICYNGADFILAVFEGERELWRYSITDNAWSLEAKLPASVLAGGDVAAKSPSDNWAGVFVIQGGGDNGFWEYTPYHTPRTTLISPADGTVFSTRTPTFEWSEVSSPAGVFYDLEISYDNLLIMSVENLRTTSYTLNRMLLNGYYTWRVVTKTGWGDLWTETSDERRFIISSPIPVESTFVWSQSDWSGPSGVNFWDNAAGYYAGEQVDTSDNDSVKLAPKEYQFGNNAADISSSPIWKMAAPTEWSSIRFTARSSKVLDKIRVYVSPVYGTPPAYTFGIQVDDGTGQPSGTYLSSENATPTTAGWYVIDIPDVQLAAGGIYHIVVKPADISSDENAIAIRRSSPLHGLVPSQQTAEADAYDSEANTLLTKDDGYTWGVQNSQSIYVLDFTDNTHDGNPYAVAGYHLPIDGQNYAGQVFKAFVNVGITKAGFFIQKVGQAGSGPSLYFTLVDVDNGAVLENSMFATFSEVPESYGWVDKTLPEPIWLTGGHTYRFYLWTPTGTDLYRFNAPHTDTSASPYSELTFGGVESAATYSADNGNTWTIDNARDVVFRFDVIESMYRHPSGFLTSSVYDAEEVVYWSTIEWDNVTPENTQLVVQVRADNQYPISTNWTEVENGQNLGMSARYIQYRVDLTGDNVATPAFSGIRIHYGTTPPTDWTQSNWAGGATYPTLENGTWYSIYHKYYRDENIETKGAGETRLGDAENTAHLVVSEVSAGTTSAGNEFVELYNPTQENISINNSNFKLRFVNSSNAVTTKQVTWNRNVVPAKGFFLFASPGTLADPDATFSADLMETSGVIIDNDLDLANGVIDRVAWGSPPPSNGVEGTGIATTLATGDSIERKAKLTSTAASMAPPVLQSENTWMSLSDTLGYGNGVSAAYAENGGVRYVYQLRGNGTDFYRYSIDTKTWENIASTPAAIGAGGALVYAENNGIKYLFALRGGGGDNFYRYDVATNSWTNMATFGTVSTGGSLVWTGGDNIYALRGGTAELWRYSICQNSWTQLASRYTFGAGAALAWGGGDILHAFKGGNSTTFYRYKISTNSWTSPGNAAAAPATVGAGGSLAWIGGDFIYAVRGGGNADFWRYNMSSNSWDAKASLLENVGTNSGNRLVHKDNYLYCVRGVTTLAFWRYAIVTTSEGGENQLKGNSYDTDNNSNDFIVHRGYYNPQNSLSGTERSYLSSGYLESSIYDAEQLVPWENITWDASTPAGTNIAVEVRTSENGATWSGWETVTNGENLAISARYIQYRAKLSTDNALVTPLLYEIRICFDPDGPGLLKNAIYGLRDLVDVFRHMEIQHGVKNSLMAKLQNSLQKLESALEVIGSQRASSLLNTAIKQLEAFINQVEAQSGKHVILRDAEILVERAQNVIKRINTVLLRVEGTP